MWKIFNSVHFESHDMTNLCIPPLSLSLSRSYHQQTYKYQRSLWLVLILHQHSFWNTTRKTSNGSNAREQSDASTSICSTNIDGSAAAENRDDRLWSTEGGRGAPIFKSDYSWGQSWGIPSKVRWISSRYVGLAGHDSTSEYSRQWSKTKTHIYSSWRLN